jgi:glycopeptide antibiotics resistance protein
VVATREISGGPAGVALAVVGLVLVIWWLRRAGALTAPRVLAGAALCVYAAGVLANTAFPVFLGTAHADMPWTTYLNLVPLRGTETRDIIQNVAVFAPLGLLLPLVFSLRSALSVTVCAAALSLSIEALQLLNAVTGHGGHIADVNDLLANVVGALLGYALTRAVIQIPIIRRVVFAFAWPSSGLRQGHQP